MMSWDSSENHVFLNPRLPDLEKQRLLRLIDQVSGELKGHIFILSSGTSLKNDQKLKWVALSKDAFLCAAQSVNQHLSIHAHDHWLQLLPTFHVGGLAIWARSFLSGARVSVMSHWSVDSLISLIEDQSITHVSLVPAQVFDLIQVRKKCPRSIKFVLVGAGALSQELYAQAQSLGWPLLSTYGMTEMCSSIAITDPQCRDQNFFQSLKILPHVNLRASSNGLLELQSSALFSAYVEEDTWGQALRISPLRENGWYSTSDRGVLEGSYLRLLGRESDYIKIGGESVELARLNSILDQIKLELHLTADFVVIPYPDERLGHVIHFVSDTKLKLDEFERLREVYHSRVFPFEKMRHWHVLPQIPRTELKKLKLTECLEMVKLYFLN